MLRTNNKQQLKIIYYDWHKSFIYGTNMSSQVSKTLDEALKNKLFINFYYLKKKTTCHAHFECVYLNE